MDYNKFEKEMQEDLMALRAYLKVDHSISPIILSQYRTIFNLLKNPQIKNNTMSAEKIKSIRVKIDKCISTIDAGMLAESPSPNSREVALAKTELQRGKMRLGKILSELNERNPYPESKNPDSLVIEKQADKSCETYKSIMEGVLHVAKVKYMRNEIDKIVNDMKEIFITEIGDSGLEISHAEAIYRDLSIVAVEEAGMWLGQELNRIFEKK